MTKQVDVEKLAEFVGFTHLPYTFAKTKYKLQDRCWVEPGYKKQTIGHWSFNLPDFTDPIWGIAYCYKWIVPNLQKKGYMIELFANEHSGFLVKIYTIFQSVREPEEYYEPIAEAKDDNPALAFCMALEKLVDTREVKDERAR